MRLCVHIWSIRRNILYYSYSNPKRRKYRKVRMIYGYVRVSTELQMCENQHYEIEQYCQRCGLSVDEWIEEKISGTADMKKRKLGGLLNKLKKDDILIATELSRLGRNLMQVMVILQHCLDVECQVWTTKEKYKLGSDIQSKVLAFAFGLSAEIERQLISQRTKECFARLKAEGRHLGRPFGFSYTSLKGKEEEIADMLQRKVPKAQIARIFGVGRTTMYRFIKTYITADIGSV